jgi:hypothetical protein
MHIATSYLYMFESENVSTLCESTWISVDKMMVTWLQSVPKTMIYNFTPLANRNRQFSAFYLVLNSIVGCIVAHVALFLNKNKKSFRKYPVFNSTFTLNTREFIDAYILELSCRSVRTQYLINFENNKTLKWSGAPIKGGNNIC